MEPQTGPAWYRHFFSIMLLPVTATLVVPSAIFLFGGSWDTRLPESRLAVTLLRAAGFVFLFPGASLLVWTNLLFSRLGKGTLAPWDPTQRLVVAGPYRHVRNPMISGVMMILVAESLLLGSILILGWALGFFLLNHFYFLVSEEPGLRKRFGKSFDDYRQHVPRWVPRLSPWDLKEKQK